MSYQRVIPRDLFNEANLLKCYGHLYILTEGNPNAHFAEDFVDSFDIVQDDDGGLIVQNLPFVIRGVEYELRRPLNSRRPWPLYARLANDVDFEDVEVFDDHGNLTPEFGAMVNAGVAAL